MLVGDIHGSLCNKLVKHGLYGNFDLKFYENINAREDLLIWVQLFSKTIKVGYFDQAYYYYNLGLNPNSIMTRYTNKHYEWHNNFIYRLKEFLSADEIFDAEIILQEIDHYLYAYIGGLITLKEFKQKMTIKHMWYYLFRNKYQSVRMKLLILIKRYFYY